MHELVATGEQNVHVLQKHIAAKQRQTSVHFSSEGHLQLIELQQQSDALTIESEQLRVAGPEVQLRKQLGGLQLMKTKQAAEIVERKHRLETECAREEQEAQSKCCDREISTTGQQLQQAAPSDAANAMDLAASRLA